MRAIFQEKRKKEQKKFWKKEKYLKSLVTMYKIWKYLEKGQVTVCDYRTQQTAKKGPGTVVRIIVPWYYRKTLLDNELM